MTKKLKRVVDFYWKRSKAFRIIVIAAFFLFLSVPIFLLTVYARILFSISFWVLLFIVRLVFGYISRKEGYVERATKLSPKHYHYTRRVEVVVGGGLFTGFAIMTIWRVFTEPLPQHSFLLFLILISVGAYVSDKVGRKLGWY
ncbi:MAG: hypothetical protein K6T73_08260 [Candidatus Bathyarchaeota archaeon]|nr:hypothetical protein [Candidatus Bathyarchaeota archaeon]